MTKVDSSYLACDLGAESGRVILGRLSADGLLTIQEVHRFPNFTLSLLGSLRWNLLGLFREILTGLTLAGAGQRERGGQAVPIRGVSVDSWGVDYALHNAGEPMLAPAWCYRDGRTDTIFAGTRADEAACERIFAETGVQFQAFNTLYQLRAERGKDPRISDSADGFLLVADYLNYLLSGVARAEESLASTTQLYRPGQRAWSTALQEEYAIPARLFPSVVPSATVLGPLRPDLAQGCGLDAVRTGPVQVIATCSHDTGAAVAAVPVSGESAEGWAYLISGTWSLLGVEREQPVLTAEAQAANFTNEVGVGGSIRFLKNIAGLWLLQESRRHWERQGQTFTYPRLVALAKAAPPFGALVQPNAARFAKPGDMPGKIAAYCRETGQPVPETPGEVARCIFESLALLYRQTVEDLERLTNRKIHVLHVVGGGSQNRLLNQFTANATGRQVLAGPVEATAIGNVLLQALALGEVDSWRSLRSIVANSFPIRIFRPAQRARWDATAARFASLTLVS